MNKRFGVAILGGSGYGAGELLRILSMHPDIEVCSVTSRSHAGNPVSSIHSHLKGTTSLNFDKAPQLTTLKHYERSVLVLAMPTGLAVSAIETALAQGLSENTSVIDLSGDLRLRDAAQHQQFYPEVEFSAELRAGFTYGLTELSRREISQARFITNPGCLASAAILALAPLVSKPLTGQVVVDAKTGTSGAGRELQASMHHPSRTADFTAYKTLQHRHEPEILQALGPSFNPGGSFIFSPHLLPVSRGIFVSAYLSLTESCSAEALTQHYHNFYADSPFIRLRDTPPRLADVVGTNFCDIAVTVRGNQVVIMSAIDNLGKGMAGQAIQNMNLLFGLPEKTGLMTLALGPV